MRSPLPLALLLLTAAGCGAPLSPSAASTFDHATQLVVMRIAPEGDAPPGPDVFEGHRVLARAEVRDPALRREIREIVDAGLAKGGTQAKCFNPRHAIHATNPGHVVDVLVCFECSSAEIDEDGQADLRPFGDVAARLDQAFATAGVRAPR
jgi:hypothetical protein